jgi:hypothetical protein
MVQPHITRSNMSKDTSTPNHYEHIDTAIRALKEATTEEERRMYMRGVLRWFEQMVGEVHSRLSDAVDAVTHGAK